MSDPVTEEIVNKAASLVAEFTACGHCNGECSSCQSETQALLEVVAPMIAKRAWSEGFNEAHIQHFQEDVRLSRRTPAIAYKNPYEEG